ncbi:MAG TPA: 3-dehydroquinate synthase II, partial [Guyparkeria sp.]|nr:3-dehydroquinate synthase II [Guyparkeria sp.]
MSDSPARKHIWIEPARHDDVRLAQAAADAGATALVLPKNADTAGLPRVGPGGDFQESRNFDRYRIQRQSDEESIRRDRLAVIEPAEWSIIPAENLIARGLEVIQVIDTAAQAKLALTIMEQGVAGIWLRQADIAAIEALGRVLAELHPA